MVRCVALAQETTCSLKIKTSALSRTTPRAYTPFPAPYSVCLTTSISILSPFHTLTFPIQQYCPISVPHRSPAAMFLFVSGKGGNYAVRRPDVQRYTIFLFPQSSILFDQIFLN